MNTQFSPRWLSRFARDKRGVSAVEFALVLPLMLTLYFGGNEVSQGIAASRKVTLVSRTVGDLVSQASSLTVTQLNDILNASATVISPFPSSNLRVTVSQIKIDAKKKQTIEWEQSYNGGVSDAGATPSVPDALITPNADTFLIWARAEYDYKPTIGYTISGDMALKDQIYMRPRAFDTRGITYPAPTS
jgi:Flp pilus assembly protein TadG